VADKPTQDFVPPGLRYLGNLRVRYLDDTPRDYTLDELIARLADMRDAFGKLPVAKVSRASSEALRRLRLLDAELQGDSTRDMPRMLLL
jgi:hypothetical protein